MGKMTMIDIFGGVSASFGGKKANELLTIAWILFQSHPLNIKQPHSMFPMMWKFHGNSQQKTMVSTGWGPQDS